MFYPSRMHAQPRQKRPFDQPDSTLPDVTTKELHCKLRSPIPSDEESVALVWKRHLSGDLFKQTTYQNTNQCKQIFMSHLHIFIVKFYERNRIISKRSYKSACYEENSKKRVEYKSIGNRNIRYCIYAVWYCTSPTIIYIPL